MFLEAGQISHIYRSNRKSKLATIACNGCPYPPHPVAWHRLLVLRTVIAPDRAITTYQLLLLLPGVSLSEKSTVAA